MERLQQAQALKQAAGPPTENTNRISLDDKTKFPPTYFGDPQARLTPPTEQDIWQYKSNAYAEANPLYGAARGAAGSYLTLPLEPRGEKPLVDPSEASRNPSQIFEWWQQWPDANIGVATGPASDLVVLRIEGEQGRDWLRARASAHVRVETNEEGERVEVGLPYLFDVPFLYAPMPAGGQVTSTAPVWGSQAMGRQAMKLRAKNKPSGERAYYMRYPVPKAQVGYDFATRQIAPGVELFADGAVVVWSGSVTPDGRTVYHRGAPEPMPYWLAEQIGKPAKRK